MGLSRHSWNGRDELTIPAGCRIWELLVKIPNLSRWNTWCCTFFCGAASWWWQSDRSYPCALSTAPLFHWLWQTCQRVLKRLKAVDSFWNWEWFLKAVDGPESRRSECQRHWQHGSPGQQQFFGHSCDADPSNSSAQQGNGRGPEWLKEVVQDFHAWKSWGLLVLQFCSSDTGQVLARTVERP